MKPNWQVLHPEPIMTPQELVEVMSTNRGIENIAAFLNPPSPVSFSLHELDISQDEITQAVTLLATAIRQKQPILIFGDYDADGICATAVAWLVLTHLGAVVRPYIPSREKHGYGLSVMALEDACSTSVPSLILTVDNGIVAHSAVKYAQERGIQVVITDHHTPDATPLPADAVVHTTQVCGTAVSWLLMRELVKAVGGTVMSTSDLSELLDIVGIATIADQVTLHGPNRAFAFHGLAQLKITKRPGIRALCAVSNITQENSTEETVGFVLAPRINASGRIGDPLVALRLLCTQSPQLAQMCAIQLDSYNTQRQRLTAHSVALLDESLSQDDNQLLVCFIPEVHDGIIGLVAGKYAQQYHKPTIIMTQSGQVIKGSARSIPGFHITAFLRRFESEFIALGGHEQASGFSLDPAKIESLTNTMRTLANQVLTTAMTTPGFIADAVLDHSMLHTNTVNILQQFAPFGQGNTIPTFICSHLLLRKTQQMGNNKQHLRLEMQTQQGDIVTGVQWQAPQLEFPTGKKISVLGNLSINTWQDKKSLQLLITDITL